MTTHIFSSKSGELLPRWRTAFPKALAVSGANVSKVPLGEKLVWVRLQAEVDFAKTVESIRLRMGNVGIVAMSDLPGDEEALACFSAGARGYCNTHAMPELFRSIADVVLQGGLWIGETLMHRLLQGTARIVTPVVKEAEGEWAALLTDREKEVAIAIAEGASNKEIARNLEITERTVKAHASAIFTKLNVRDRLQLSLVVHGRRHR